MHCCSRSPVGGWPHFAAAQRCRWQALQAGARDPFLTGCRGKCGRGWQVRSSKTAPSNPAAVGIINITKNLSLPFHLLRRPSTLQLLGKSWKVQLAATAHDALAPVLVACFAPTTLAFELPNAGLHVLHPRSNARSPEYRLLYPWASKGNERWPCSVGAFALKADTMNSLACIPSSVADRDSPSSGSPRRASEKPVGRCAWPSISLYGSTRTSRRRAARTQPSVIYSTD